MLKSFSTKTRESNILLDEAGRLTGVTGEIVTDLRSIDAAAWNALCDGNQPFVQHEFLSALETWSCVSPDTGWTPQHLTLSDARGVLTAAMPFYLKEHSWGEFVFDFAWAQAYARAGLAYYPKLLCMSPFTPVTGQRLLITPGSGARDALLGAAVQHAKTLAVSSVHILFPPHSDLELLRQHGFLIRKDCRFLWNNEGYRSFDDYLATLRSAKRKKMRRERRRITEQGIRVSTHHGDQLDAATWQTVYRLTAGTFLRRGHTPYLSLDFFRSTAATLGDRMLVNLAQIDTQIVGAAILFRDDYSLYGRYWGAVDDIDCLHFETCYYRGIEYCIEQGLASFDPGTQGEHKVTRGFAPVPTYSAHWIADERFRNAIANYLESEATGVDDYLAQIARHLPFSERV